MAFALKNAQVFYRDENEKNGVRTVGLKDADTTVFTSLWPTNRDGSKNPLYDSAWAELVLEKDCNAKVRYYRKTKGGGDSKRTFHNFVLVDFDTVT